MKSDKVFKILNWVLLIVIIIASIVSYKYLPAKVALHIGITGELSNYVSKGIAAVAVPAIVLLLNIYSSFIDKEEKGVKFFFISLIIIAAHIFLLYKNL
ncbi:MAG: DUF1648 domain-containing protein [Bacillota bacterium]|nr:DUF1648 domain-containing protein [Bacillota bacterium]